MFLYGNEEEVWNPLTDQVVHEFSNAAVIGASGNLVVWESAGHCVTGCSVHVFNVQTGSERAVRLPPAVTTTGDAEISPDGSTIAITGALSGTSLIPHPQAVLLIHPHARVAKVLAGSEQPTNPDLGPMALTWSTNGWLFSSTVGTTTVHAWRPGESRALVLPKLRLPKVTHLVNEDPSLIAL
jgi:WD40 repeat protein